MKSTPITEMSHQQLSLEGKLVVQGPLLPSLLPEAKELAVVVSTIGPRLEKQVTDYTNQGEPLRGMLLDGIGSAAVDSLTQEVCKLIAGEALSRGYQASSPVSPGMPGLPITEQWPVAQNGTSKGNWSEPDLFRNNGPPQISFHGHWHRAKYENVDTG